MEKGKTMRDTLIQLLRKAGCGFEYRSAAEIADDLIACGVTVAVCGERKDNGC